jgi:hypothetical protein
MNLRGIQRGALFVGTMVLVGASSLVPLVLVPATPAASATTTSQPTTTNATGSCISLGDAGSYSEYSTSTALVMDDTTDGGVAYGGQATLTGDSYATASAPSSQVTLLAG